MTKSFDRVAETYDATRGGEARGRWIAADLEPLFSSAGPVLEIGVGTGAIALGLGELGRAVSGVDVGLQMAKRARERIGRRVVVGDAECLPVRTSSVANAYSVWLLHLVDVTAVFKGVTRILRPGGRYVVSQGQERELTAVEQIEAEMFLELRRDNTASTSKTDFSEIAESAGLTPVDRMLGAPQSYGVTPEKAAHRIEQRSKSALWDVSPDRWGRSSSRRCAGSVRCQGPTSS